MSMDYNLDSHIMSNTFCIHITNINKVYNTVDEIDRLLNNNLDVSIYDKNKNIKFYPTLFKELGKKVKKLQ